MGILGDIAEGGIAKTVEAVGNLYTTDKARIEAEADLAAASQPASVAQIQNNSLMLSSKYFFESAWQALSGWTAGLCLVLYWIPQLLVTNYIWISNCFMQNTVLPFPIAAGDIMQLVYLMFGFGTYHLIKKKVLG